MCEDQIGVEGQKLFNERRNTSEVTVGVTYNDFDGTTVDPAQLRKRVAPLAEFAACLASRDEEHGEPGLTRLSGRRQNGRGHCWRLLRMCRQRPLNKSANEKRNHLAPVHSITSSAR